MFNDLLPEFEKADFSIVNLECPLIKERTPIVKTGPVLGVDDDCVSGLKHAGIDVVNIANNHIMDHGPTGLRNTLRVCSEARISTVGAGENIEAARRILISKIGKIRVGLLGVAEHEFSIATNNSWGANPLDLLDYVRNVRDSTDNLDYLIVLVHGGNEYYPFHSPRLQDTCHFMVEIGANAVIVQHTHCPGNYEEYQNGHIVYGQGNLIFDRPNRDRAFYEGFLVKLSIAENLNSTMEIVPYFQSNSQIGARKMGAHPRIATVSEMTGVIEGTDLDNYECSCGRLLKNCDFWKSVSSQVQKIHKDFSYKNSKTRYIPRGDGFIDRLQFSNLRNNMLCDLRDSIFQRIPSYKSYSHEIMQRNIDLANIILDMTKKDIFFDTSKAPHRVKFLKQYLQTEFKIIHLVKDGRGVFDSIKRYKPYISDHQAIMAWVITNRHAERVTKYVKKKDRYFLRYQDLVLNTERELIKLSRFIGIEENLECLNFRDYDHHIIGNTNMRLAPSNEIFHDEKWKTSLSSEQLKLFGRLAGRMNRRYGYSL